jgi:hypothetical protein
MTAQIFVSYARDDDATPPDLAAAKGFVSYLNEQLRYEFTTNYGQPRPTIWQDRRHIDRGEQFDPVIAAALAESSLLVVVLSRNWLFRPYCRYELDAFAKRWASDDMLSLKRRIVVVAKNYVRSEDRPPLLQGQEGYSFFYLDDPKDVGQEVGFFERGQVRDERYFDTLKELSSRLWRVAQRPEFPGGALPELSPDASKPNRDGTPSASTDSARRTVYLAKPAGDMRQAYQRVVEELDRRGYDVLPPPEVEIPNDVGAEAFVDDAIGKAEASVHLIGERLGYAPESAEPISKLQLARAALRAEAPAGDAATREFRRIIWAPRVVTEANDPAARQSERDPLAVLAKFDHQIAGDKIESRALSDFVTFLIGYLDSTAPHEPQPEPLQAEAAVYIYHQSADTSFAIGLAKALKERHIRTVFPALEGDPAELEAMHRKKLADCDAIILCWATASEVWIHAQSDGLKDWREFGRKQRFAFRSVAAGPPPGIRKQVFVEFPPSDEIDLVLDLTNVEKAQPEAFDPLVRAAHIGPP